MINLQAISKKGLKFIVLILWQTKRETVNSGKDKLFPSGPWPTVKWAFSLLYQKDLAAVWLSAHVTFLSLNLLSLQSRFPAFHSAGKTLNMEMTTKFIALMLLFFWNFTMNWYFFSNSSIRNFCHIRHLSVVVSCTHFNNSRVLIKSSLLLNIVLSQNFAYKILAITALWLSSKKRRVPFFRLMILKRNWNQFFYYV